MEPQVTCPMCSQLGHRSGGAFCATCQTTFEPAEKNDHAGHHTLQFPKCYACEGTGKAEDAMRRKVQGLWYAH